MNKPARFSLTYYLGLFLVMFLLDSVFFSGHPAQEIPYSEFLDRVDQGAVQSVIITKDKLYGLMKEPSRPENSTSPQKHELPTKHTPWRLGIDEIRRWFQKYQDETQKSHLAAESEAKRHFTVVRVDDPDLVQSLQARGVEYRAEIDSDWLGNFISNWILPIALMFVFWGFLMRRMRQGPGALSIGKSKAKVYEADPNNRVTFADVAGVDEAIEETREVVSFLEQPGKYLALGATLPKGVLLVGPPGTGKTLLAKAIAGEAKVPFFSLSGSDFVEMFVGVGAARVRDLFKAAKEKAPCIIFIDELDAIGKSRAQSAVTAGGFDERENTLNQLLVELDGFDGSAGVVLIGATNRPEVLDRALLRPGRFDRQILVGRPHRDGRLAILNVHAKKLSLAEDVKLAEVAAQTPGFVGADLANICNEAALLAARNEHQHITMADFQDAIERVIGGLERKGNVLNPRERRIVAYHESGHTLVSHFTPGSDPVQKVSIVPRGQGALGYTLQSPLEDRYLMSQSELMGRVKVLLGGRAAEEIVFGEISTGASDDLEKASKITRDMITTYGMSKRLPNLSLVDQSHAGFLGQSPNNAPHSGEIEQIIGEESLEILRTCYEGAKALITEKRDKLERLAERLLDQEKLEASDIDGILEKA